MSDWIAPKCKYHFEGKRIIAEGFTPQKVTGTSMAGMIARNPYQSPFATVTKLMGVWDEDISDKAPVIAGKLLEERIIDYLANKKSGVGQFFKADDLFAKREGEHSGWVSDFDDDVFAGHVDGIISKDGKDYILEIKTTSRRNIESGAWIHEIPEHYLWQVCLYNHFITHQNKAYFGLGVLEQEDYSNPNGWVANSRNCYLFEVPIDTEMVARTVEKVREIYRNTVLEGVSPEYDENNDRDIRIVNYLKDIAGTVEELNALVEQYTAVKQANAEYDSKNKSNVELEKSLSERVKDVMTIKGMSSIGNLTLRKSERKSFDFATADMDGFDYEKYLKTTQVNTLAIKKKKE